MLRMTRKSKYKEINNHLSGKEIIKADQKKSASLFGITT